MDGLSYWEIARLVGSNVSRISREIRRNCTYMYDIPTYYPHTAQKKYLLRRFYCHRGLFHLQEMIDYIDEKLKANLITGTNRLHTVQTKNTQLADDLSLAL